MQSLDLSSADPIDLPEALAKAATLQEDMAESLHDLADLMVAVDTDTAQEFYRAADQAHACVRQFRLLSTLFPNFRSSFRIVFGVGVVAGLILGWLSHLLLSVR
jgi:hypothetical protein